MPINFQPGYFQSLLIRLQIKKQQRTGNQGHKVGFYLQERLIRDPDLKHERFSLSPKQAAG